MNTKRYFHFVYYRLFEWSKKKWGNDFPQFYAVVSVTTLICINILTILGLINYFFSEIFVFFFQRSFIKFLFLYIPLLIFFSIYFLTQGRYKNIIETYHENPVLTRNKNSRKQLEKFYVFYLAATIVCFIIVVIIRIGSLHN